MQLRIISLILYINIANILSFYSYIHCSSVRSVFRNIYIQIKEEKNTNKKRERSFSSWTVFIIHMDFRENICCYKFLLIILRACVILIQRKHSSRENIAYAYSRIRELLVHILVLNVRGFGMKLENMNFEKI
jgi:hypothetical protein